MADAPLARSERARLLHLKRTLVVGIVGHGRAMATTPRLAADAYTGQGFQTARRWADACTDSWVIVCPRHGIVTPDQLVEPYVAELAKLSIRERIDWGKATMSAILARFAGLPVRFVAVAGEPYVELLRNQGTRIESPLRGLSFGERLAWFTTRAEQGELHVD